MYAVIKSGGKQYRVEPGQELKVEKLEAEVGATITLDDVLMVVDGDDVKLGQPALAGAKVTAEVVEQGRSKKILVIKFKRRQNYRRTKGHRQPFTLLKIVSVAA